MVGVAAHSVERDIRGVIWNSGALDMGVIGQGCSGMMHDMQAEP